MHLNGSPNAPATADAMPAIVEGLTREGFEFLTVGQQLSAVQVEKR
jgi:hypothetical protein